MKTKHLIAAALLGMASFAQSAIAAPITFSFTSDTSGIHSVSSPYTQTVSGITASVTGSDDLYNTRQGIAVGDDALTTAGEEISFSFSPNTVSLLTGIVFEVPRTDPGAAFDLYGDAVFLGHFSIVGAFDPYFITLDLSGYNWSAETFTFIGSDDGGTNPDGFRIKRLIVDAPEPGILALMGASLLLMSAGVRRRKS
jgi:hypothetical protein